MKTVYTYPHTEVGNKYINKTLSVWERMGYATRPARELLRPNGRSGRRADRIVVLNWYEDWMLNSKRPAWISAALAALTALAFRVLAGRFVWVRHNFKPHYLPRSTGPHRFLLALLGLLADEVVTHRPVDGIASTVVPHPLLPMENIPVAATRDIPYLWFGVVQRYKKLDQLLREWPVALPLRIMGRSKDAELTATIESVIRERGLDVEWRNAWIPDEELDQTLTRSQLAIMAHDDQSMIVSGAYYHALTYGVNLLIADGDFVRKVGANQAGVHVYAPGRLAEALAGLAPMPADAVVRNAEASYGDAVFGRAWGAVLEG